MKVTYLTALRISQLLIVLIRIQVKLPAEQEDFMKRPAYVSQNNAGVPICENRLKHFCLLISVKLKLTLYRLQYLVAKGAILRKGFVYINIPK